MSFLVNSYALGWTPAELGSALALWLDAADSSTITLNGSTVAQWQDKSGNGRHATQGTPANRPTYALNTVSFDGVNDILALTQSYGSTSQDSLSFFAVASSNGTSVVLGTADLTIFSHRTSFTQIRPADGSTAASSIFIPTFADSNYHFQSIVISGASIKSWDDGSANANLTAPKSLWNFGGSQYLARGDGSAGNTLYQINIREIVIAPVAVSDSIRQKLEGYLAHKWGLVANLPSNHPYKTVAP